MSDPRFARLKTDPRFRRPKTKSTKVVIDERFKSVFESGKGKGKSGKAARKVDKYGRPVSKTQDEDNLRRYYRLENDDEDGQDKSDEEEAPRKPDLARGEVLLESSSEEEDEEDDVDSADDGGFVTLGADSSRPITVPDEIDLDEDEDSAAYAYAEAQAAQYAQEHQEEDDNEEGGAQTRRLAIVNLDWEHVRAHHLFKICASLVSPTAPAVPASSSASSSRIEDTGRNKKRSSQGAGGGGVTVAQGRVLSVRVYPSDFGKARMAREEVEGPPAHLFRSNKKPASPEDINERTVYEVGGEDEEVDEDALRRYQLDRLRYYYAIVECDSVAAASHIFGELEGTELERSANLFDLSYVPDGMTFENEPRDEATEEMSMGYKPVEYVTDALRHSKVKLTWDDDDPERNQVTRRALTKKEIEENDFRAYIASTSSESEGDDDDADADLDQAQSQKVPGKKDKDKKGKKEKKAARDKMRALLLGGNDDAMPEGWGDDGGDDDVDMEITFTPGLTGKKDDGEETTLEKYQRKMREKRKKRKEEVKGSGKGHEREEEGGDEKERGTEERDEFFEAGSDEEEAPKKATTKADKRDKKDKKGKKPSRHPVDSDEEAPTRKKEATAEELALLVASDNPSAEPKHFNLKAVIKAEKAKKGKNKIKGRSKKGAEDKEEAQEDFVMDVKDDRFRALFEDHQYAIDPTNPHFKKTKAMTALLDERQKRQRAQRGEERPDAPASSAKRKVAASDEPGAGAKSLQSLVESVKRKSANVEAPGQGKRRKL